MNGDGGTGNDLIYIPRDMAEMNFVAFTAGRPHLHRRAAGAGIRGLHPAGPYLSKHRGEYAERGAVFLPMVRRIDLSITQDVFRNIRGKRNTGQFRIDFTNFGNLLNHNWGVSERFVVPVTQANGAQILTTPTADAQGAPTTAGGRERTARDESFQPERRWRTCTSSF